MGAHRRSGWLRGLVAAAIVAIAVPVIDASGVQAVVTPGGTLMSDFYENPGPDTPFVSEALGQATASPATYSEGDLITVRFTMTAPVETCTGVTPGPDPTPFERSAGGYQVRMSWGAATLVDWSPGTEVLSAVGSSGSVQWSAQNVQSKDDWITPGDQLEARFRAPFDSSAGVHPLIQVWVYRLRPTTCTSIDDQGLLRAYGNGNPIGTGLPVGPVAYFDHTVSDDDPLEVSFQNRSMDPDGDFDDLSFAWDFGDGTPVSTEAHPVHRYERPGSYHVTLTVTDANEEVDTHTATVEVGALGLEVNSAGDAAAEDPERGCDTGGTVDGAPECTLRAAIESAEAAGGGDITFAIDTGGIPEISAGSPLPALTTTTTIDGTTQPGGWVAVSGAGARTLELAGGTSTVKGLALGGTRTAVAITGGNGHVVSGNRLGTNGTGTTADDQTDIGVDVRDASGVEISDNTSGADVGVMVDASAPGVVVKGNRLGVLESGSGPLGNPSGGVGLFGSSGTIEDNVVRGHAAGIAVLGADATDAKVVGNKVGVNAGGSAALPGSGVGIHVDGAPRATVSGNRVAGLAQGLIQVTGAVQHSWVDGKIEFGEPSSDEPEGPVTGVGTSIVGNTLGFAGAEPANSYGIVTWAGASKVTISDNTILQASLIGIDVDGGDEHRIVANRLGTEAAPVRKGIDLFDVDDATIGTIESPNVIWAEGRAIDLQGHIGSPSVIGNEVHSVAGETSGISLTALTVEPTIVANRIDGADVGVSAGPAPDATIRANVVSDGKTGIQSLGAGATIADNVVADQTSAGITAAGEGTVVSGNSVVRSGVGVVVSGVEAEVTENRLGLEPGSSTVEGNAGAGLGVAAGDAKVSRNLIAGSGGPGVTVAASARADLRGNRIWQSAEGQAIDSPAGPPAPQLVAAIQTGSGETLRRTLLLDGLPAGDAGRIEVFANDSCDGPEAQHLLDVVRHKAAGETTRVIQIRGAQSRDHFTVSYTDSEGNTSELSTCESAGTYPDADGDGAVDPLDEILGVEDDPTKAVIATDQEQLLLLSVEPHDPATGVGGGQLEGVTAIDDPAPGSHPEGWSLPYGALRFRITGVTPGGRTSATLTAVSGDGPIAGDSYWKYGPQTTGGAPGWYEFAYDEDTGTGATSGTASVGDLGPRRVFTLHFADGARGDSDGGANGTITDPGGPVLFDGDTTPTTPTVPTTPTTPTTPTAPTTPTSPTTPNGPETATPGPGAEGGSGSRPTGSGGTGVDSGTLPRAGWSTTDLVVLGIALVLGGGAVLALRARVRRKTIGA